MITEKQKNEDLTARNVELRLRLMKLNKLVNEADKKI